VNDAFARRIARTPAPSGSQSLSRTRRGLLMEKELHYLHEELDHPGKPFVVIMGGAKVSDKIGVLKALMKRPTRFNLRRDANTFFKAQGFQLAPGLRQTKLIWPTNYSRSQKSAT